MNAVSKLAMRLEKQAQTTAIPAAPVFTEQQKNAISVTIDMLIVNHQIEYGAGAALVRRIKNKQTTDLELNTLLSDWKKRGLMTGLRNTMANVNMIVTLLESTIIK